MFWYPWVCKGFSSLILTTRGILQYIFYIFYILSIENKYKYITNKHLRKQAIGCNCGCTRMYSSPDHVLDHIERYECAVGLAADAVLPVERAAIDPLQDLLDPAALPPRAPENNA